MKNRLFIIFTMFLIVSCASITGKRHIVPIDDAPRMGPAGAPVTMVEFVNYT